MTKKQATNKCYAAALRMLTRREHSQFEIKQKLLHKDFELDDIDQAITKLTTQGYQSDTRFTDSLIRTRYNQGKGSLIIIQQLKQHDITNYNLSEYDFFALAHSVRTRKYGEVPKNYQQKAKQMRFLQSRGFSFEEIDYAFKK